MTKGIFAILLMAVLFVFVKPNFTADESPPSQTSEQSKFTGFDDQVPAITIDTPATLPQDTNDGSSNLPLWENLDHPMRTEEMRPVYPWSDGITMKSNATPTNYRNASRTRPAIQRRT